MALPDDVHRPVHVNSFIDPQKGAGQGSHACLLDTCARAFWSNGRHGAGELGCCTGHASPPPAACGCPVGSGRVCRQRSLTINPWPQATWTKACTPQCRWSPAKLLSPMSTRQVGRRCRRRFGARGGRVQLPNAAQRCWKLGRCLPVIQPLLRPFSSHPPSLVQTRSQT